MALVFLTDTIIKSAAAAPGKRLELTDARCQGLVLRVTGNGVKTFAFIYRSPATNKFARLTLGRYPTVALKDARVLAAAHRADVVEGREPRGERVPRRCDGVAFKLVADAYVENYAKRNKSSWKNDESYLRRPRAKWAGRAVTSITDADAAELLEDIARHAPVTANRTQSVLHRLFEWAKEPARRYVASNPFAGMRRQTVERPKSRVLTDEEVRVLWHALDSPELPTDRPVALALKLVLCTAARPGMAAGLERCELQGADWHLPAHRMKGRRPFVLPLNELARSIINEAFKSDEQIVAFPSRFHARAAVARHSLSQASLAICERFRMAKWTPHDLRRTAATIARRAGAARADVKALLAHVDSDVTAVYDQYDMLPEKRAAVNILNAELRRICGN